MQGPALRVTHCDAADDLHRDTEDLNMRKLANMNKSEDEIRELTDTELNTVVGAKQKPDGTAAGNVAAKWNVAQGAAA